MKRTELEEAIRYATRVTEQREVLVIGSQAILGSYEETQLPERATPMPGSTRPTCREACSCDEKDFEFVDALVEAGLIDPVSLVRICRKLPVTDTRRNITIQRAQDFLPG